MADYGKDSEKQAALRKKINEHPIWKYPPQERLRHNLEWQDLYMLVFSFKGFEAKLEKRLNNSEVNQGVLQDEEDYLREARYTRRQKLRFKLETMAFTESMRKAVVKYDVSSEKDFLAYFDAIYANEVHESVNSPAMRDQADVRLTRQESQLWKKLCELCEKQKIDPKNLPDSFYEKAAGYLGTDQKALRRLIYNVSTFRMSFSLDAKDENGEPVNDMENPMQENIEDRLDRTAEALYAITLFAKKDVEDYARIFFTNDVLKPMCTDKPDLPPERYCSMLEKKEELLWKHIFVLQYIEFLFAPHKPQRLHDLLDLIPKYPLQDSSIAAYKKCKPAAVSQRRKNYRNLLAKIMQQLRAD